MESQSPPPPQGRGGGGGGVSSSRHVHQQGRIHYLHFTCHAPLPMGTTLRVTSSTLNPLPPACTGGGVGGGVVIAISSYQMSSRTI